MPPLGADIPFVFSSDPRERDTEELLRRGGFNIDIVYHHEANLLVVNGASFEVDRLASGFLRNVAVQERCRRVAQLAAERQRVLEHTAVGSMSGQFSFSPAQNSQIFEKDGRRLMLSLVTPTMGRLTGVAADGTELPLLSGYTIETIYGRPMPPEPLGGAFLILLGSSYVVLHKGVVVLTLTSSHAMLWQT